MAEVEKATFSVLDGGVSEGSSTSYEAPNLTFGGGSGGGGMDKDYVDARIEAVKAQNDAHFAEVRSDISAISAKLDDKPGILSIIGIAVAGFLGVVSVLAFGGDRFDGGVQMQSTVSQIAVENQKISQENAQNIAGLIQIIRGMEGRNDQPQTSPQEGQD